MNNINEMRYDNDGHAVNESMPFPQAQEIDEHYLIEKINEITAGGDYLRDALRALNELSAGAGSQPNDGFGVQGKAEAIANVIQAREATHQQMIRLLEKIYDRKNPNEAQDKMDHTIGRFETFCETLRKFVDEDGNYPGEVLEILRDTSKRIFA